MATQIALTAAAQRAENADRAHAGVVSRRQLDQRGVDSKAVESHFRAGRWRPIGRAVATHAARLSIPEQRRAALINCGPGAVLASFTAAQSFGLQGWERDEIHVLVPRGARVRRPPEVHVVVHRRREWDQDEIHSSGQRQRLAPALILAAGSLTNPRPACALLAAAVQQRLLRPDALLAALVQAERVRHRPLLRAAVNDIAMGAHALSEIDFFRICRRNRLPTPTLQSVRRAPGGRRRYLDAEWTRPDGRRVVAEVDGALHLRPANWVEDQLRQNELTLARTVVLRFPAIILRTDEALVVEQLRRALGLA